MNETRATTFYIGRVRGGNGEIDGRKKCKPDRTSRRSLLSIKEVKKINNNNFFPHPHQNALPTVLGPVYGFLVTV